MMVRRVILVGNRDALAGHEDAAVRI